jgi:hypothetical protein
VNADLICYYCSKTFELFLKFKEYISFREIMNLSYILIFSLLTSRLEQWLLSRYSSGLRAGRSGFDFRRELGIFLFTTVSRTGLGPTQPPIQWVPRALSLGVKRPGREADHSPPSSAEVKNAWSYTSIPLICLHGLVLSQSTGTTLPLYLY